MKTALRFLRFRHMQLLGILFMLIGCQVKPNLIPFTVEEELFDQDELDDLGLDTLSGTQTITIYAADSLNDHYCNGVVMTSFKGMLFCQWQSSQDDEDAPDTWVAYSKSNDGEQWSKPAILVPSIKDGYCSSGGWWTCNDTLIAYIHVWPVSVKPRGGYTFYTKTGDGIHWSNLEPVLMANGDTMRAVIEQDPKVLASGRMICAAHFQPGLVVSPIYTDDRSGVRGWSRANFNNLSVDNNVSREIEPSSFVRKDSALVMVFRDQKSSYKKLASISLDEGANWSTPILTNMPDSRTKQSAGNLPDGSCYLVGNPVDGKRRSPLVLTLSEDGHCFNKAFVLRKGGKTLPKLEYEGKYKRVGYHYPKSMVWQNYLYVSYATNKERVEFTRVPLSSLK
ncbi:exo-alpha-sialidase [Carboxylicivirga sp. A043]|uniref:exo-alpha-sialidase n=1 Tax=Carboxylicivirga litoralis TaxID=2816963 RepID=UPI0021CB57D6|nr:exo-alpha-sialidase [Carboxylicivirga sp. A043]MCU4156056.1 exo-alpha-sialidase [Carboxylicivirga sp. A043]